MNTGRRLTPEERKQIHELRAQGLPIQKIAQKLDCAIYTVQWHLNRAKREAQPTALKVEAR
jgi:DNA-binding CsgD family transcriptional regulator